MKKLKSVTLSGGNNSIELPITALSTTDRFVLKSIDGLGPTEIDVKMSRSIRNRGIYQGRRPQLREVVVQIGLNPQYQLGITAGDLRDEIYDLLVPGDGVTGFTHNTITLAAHNNPYWGLINCYVKRIEIVPFSQEPLVQITFPCDSPFITAGYDSNAVPPSSSDINLVNFGTAPVGFTMSIKFTATLSSTPSFYLQRNDTGGRLSFNNSFLVDDILNIDTRPGSRKVERVRGATVTNLISALGVNEEWWILKPGPNPFTASSTSFQWINFIHRPEYWGI